MIPLWVLFVAAQGSLPTAGASALPAITARMSSTRPAINFFEDYLAAKNSHNGTKFVQYFSEETLIYYDAVLGANPNITTLSELDSSWANSSAQFDLLNVYGDLHSVAIHFVATAAAFGQEIRTLSAINTKNGKIVRQVDYWNGRNNSATTPCPERKASYPMDLGFQGAGENADPRTQRLAQKLSAAFAGDDAAAAAALFDYNATFEDLTLRVALDGRYDIQSWLQLALPLVPYGRGAMIRHVLGSREGGAYEWEQGNGLVPNGIVAFSTNEAGLIMNLKTVWDASCLSNWELDTLLSLPLSL